MGLPGHEVSGRIFIIEIIEINIRVRLVPLLTRILMFSGMVGVLIKKVSQPKFGENPFTGRGSRFDFKRTVLGRIF